jgi:hypothetical protein
MRLTKDIEIFLTKQGYTNLKEIDGKICGLTRLAFTTGLCVDLDMHGYKYRYCYSQHADAAEALAKYSDTSQHPDGDWIKRKGDGGDLSNPKLHTFED